MKRMVARMIRTTIFLVVLLSNLGSIVASSRPPDMVLLSLVPPDSQVIGAVSAPSNERRRTSFLLLAPVNGLDFADFIAITGSDASRVIRQVMFADRRSLFGQSLEHSLLVSGRFNANRIFESPNVRRVTTADPNMSLAVVAPLERERKSFSEERLLAIVDSRIALFGTRSSVNQEITRYLSKAPPDTAIIEKLNLLKNEDDSWSLIAPRAIGTEMRGMLSRLDPVLADIGEQNCPVQFGAHYGMRRVEFELVIGSSCASGLESVSEIGIKTVLSRLPEAGSSVESHLGFTRTGEYRRTITMSRVRYEEWIQALPTNERNESRSSH